MNICCVKLTEKFGSQIKRYYQTPLVVYLEALSPGLLLEVSCLNLESFLAGKFRKSLEVKISLESFNCWSFPIYG